MAGTILITGANGSLGLAAVSYALSSYPSHTLLLTVRNPSSSDPNTAKLLKTIAKHPKATVHLETLDLANLSAIATFCRKISSDIQSAKLPKIAAIICNAFTWSLKDGVKFSKDGLELDMAVNTLAHLDIILRLLGDFEPTGRILFLSSESHWPGKAGFEKIPPIIPEDLDALVKYEQDRPGEEVAKGFYRYGLSKLAGIMLMYELNRRLQKDTKLAGIRALAVDPGGLLDSRAFAQPDIPFLWWIGITIFSFLQPLIKYVAPQLNSTAGAARDVVDVAVADEFAGKEGHFLMRKQEDSSPDSHNEVVQGKLFAKSLEWCGIKQEDTVLRL